MVYNDWIFDKEVIKKSNQKYTIEFKKQVVEFYLDHYAVKETLQQFHIHESTIFAWKHQYQTRMFEKPRSTKSDSIKHMQRKLDRMKAVLEAQSILKCSPNASNAEKAKAVDSLKGRYSVRVLCDAVSLPTGTYYNRKHREQAPTQHELDDEQLKKLIILFHSDQGVQYTCDAFLSFLRENKVRQSFSTPGTPTENAVCESFFARMKFEALYRYTYLTTDELELEVGKYVDYYNNRVDLTDS